MATTEQLMAQYGIAWFGFDEASGNVIDKLGSGYVGTVTGATRVDGWNGEGYAMSFNGSNNVTTFNQKIVPIGEKTYRFKIKVTSKPSNYGVAISNAGGTADNGDIILINSDGTLRFISNKAINGAQRFYLSSTVDICDDKWHDVLLTWDGTVNPRGVKMYIDDMSIESAIGKADSIEILSQTYNLTIGKSANSANIGTNLISKIDDLQIYNKALSPSDFTQKRLAVKTTDNKNFVLSPTSTRVKEIPNTAEYMMLAQGGVVKEIDSAVDRPPIDFTKTTTEYEIVNNNRTPLGKGRVFTIPIGSDFKTAMIEDNY